MSEYFFAGLNDGGASMVLSESYMIAIFPSMVLSQSYMVPSETCYMMPNANSGTFLNTTFFLLSSVVLINKLMTSMEQNSS
jgi:hypothetical protein